MGIIISRFRKKKNTSEQLEDIEQKIKSIEKFQKDTEQQFRKVIGKLVLSSILVYLAALVIYYYYFSPDTFRQNIFKFLPLLLFPIAIYLSRKIISWYYRRKLAKNETTLKNLKVTKKTILDEVMDKETYKVAKEILEKYAPEQLNKDLAKPINANVKTVMSPSPRGDMIPRHRIVNSSMKQFNGASPLPDVAFQAVPNSSKQLQPKLSLPRPVLPRNRGAFDKLVDLVIGDGPGSRYALICRMCSSHNGMALKHEFEYLAFRCAYCLQWNPARKQRPHAPNLAPDTASHDESDANNSEFETFSNDVNEVSGDRILDDGSGVSPNETSEAENQSVDDSVVSSEDAETKKEPNVVPDLINPYDMSDLKSAVEEVDVNTCPSDGPKSDDITEANTNSESNSSTKSETDQR